MKTLADKYAGDIKMWIRLDRAIFTSRPPSLEGRDFHPASPSGRGKFAWMFFRLGGKGQGLDRCRMGREKPLDVFLFDVKTPTKLYMRHAPSLRQPGLVQSGRCDSAGSAGGSACSWSTR